MRVQIATVDDIPHWLDLAAEVEHLFGSMVNDSGFHQALHKNMDRGSAFCIHKDDGDPGSPLTGAIMLSLSHPLYKIGWLAVAKSYQRSGIGRILVQHVLALVKPPATVEVTTFGESFEDGMPARKLYQSFGFEPAELVEGPNGMQCQVFRLKV